jgi:cytochrome c5
MRILPVLFLCAPLAAFAAGSSAVAMPAGLSGALGSRSGEQIVQYQCTLCHGPGISGAPKIGDGKAWGARAQVGLDGLARSAARGRGAMPPSGGLAEITEPELRAAIAYMLERSGVKAQ